MNAAARFWAKVRKGDGCWLWLGAKHHGGYGSFCGERSKIVDAHRFAYELLIGPIPAGLEIDHLCRNRSCVNPAHMEAVTRVEHARRSILATKERCAQGHAFTTGTFLAHERPSGTRRRCRTCAADASRRYRARLRLAAG